MHHQESNFAEKRVHLFASGSSTLSLRSRPCGLPSSSARSTFRPLGQYRGSRGSKRQQAAISSTLQLVPLSVPVMAARAVSRNESAEPHCANIPADEHHSASGFQDHTAQAQATESHPTVCVQISGGTAARQQCSAEPGIVNAQQAHQSSEGKFFEW